MNPLVHAAVIVAVLAVLSFGFSFGFVAGKKFVLLKLRSEGFHRPKVVHGPPIPNEDWPMPSIRVDASHNISTRYVGGRAEWEPTRTDACFTAPCRMVLRGLKMPTAILAWRQVSFSLMVDRCLVMTRIEANALVGEHPGMSLELNPGAEIMLTIHNGTGSWLMLHGAAFVVGYPESRPRSWFSRLREGVRHAS